MVQSASEKAFKKPEMQEVVKSALPKVNAFQDVDLKRLRIKINEHVFEVNKPNRIRFSTFYMESEGIFLNDVNYANLVHVPYSKFDALLRIINKYNIFFMHGDGYILHAGEDLDLARHCYVIDMPSEHLRSVTTSYVHLPLDGSSGVCFTNAADERLVISFHLQ